MSPVEQKPGDVAIIWWISRRRMFSISQKKEQRLQKCQGTCFFFSFLSTQSSCDPFGWVQMCRLGTSRLEHQVCLYSQNGNISGRRFKETHLDRHSRPPWSQRNNHWDHQGRDLCPHGPEPYRIRKKHNQFGWSATKSRKWFIRGSMRCPTVHHILKIIIGSLSAMPLIFPS